MPIASPSTPTFSPLFRPQTRPDSTRFAKPSAVSFRHRPLSVSARLNSSTPSNGFLSPENNNHHNNDDGDGEVQHGLSLSRRRSGRGSPVYVALPADAVTGTGQVRRRKAMAQSLRALAAVRVKGMVVEVWWGVVERERPGVYDNGGMRRGYDWGCGEGETWR